MRFATLICIAFSTALAPVCLAGRKVEATNMEKALGQDYKKSCYIKPCVISGDFDGDSKPDSAVLIERKSDKKRGIAIINSSGKVFVIGAGKGIGNSGDNFAWMNHWSLYKKAVVSQGADESSPPKLIGDALLVEETGAASALIFRKGVTFIWYQQGD